MKKRYKIIFCLLFALVFAFSGCGNSFSDEVIAKIDGKEVMKSEYMVYLYTTTQNFVSTAGDDVWNIDFDGMTGEELVQERAFTTIQSVVAASQYAKENDVVLSEAQKQEAYQAATDFLEQTPQQVLQKMGVNEKKMQALMEESYLYSVVYETLAEECEVSEQDMKKYQTEYADTIRNDYTQIRLQSIMVDDAQTAEEVANKAKAGEDFETLFAEYDVDIEAKQNNKTGEMTLYQNYLKMTFGITEDLEKGQITNGIKTGDKYFVLKVMDIVSPTDEEVYQLAEQIYRNQVQSEYVDTRLSEMIETQEVEKIPDAWKNLYSFRS